MSEALIEADNIRVQFDDFLAVAGVSFKLEAGQLLGMIGPNGAGKTTALRAVAGLQTLTTGEVRILGHDVHAQPTIAGQHLAFTPDTPAVYETLTVEQFLQFIGRCYGFPAAQTDELIDHWLAVLWLADKKTEKVGSLSRGMRQRLAVARSLLPDPHVILMDEPAAGLDPAGRVEFRNMLASLRDQGKALIISSHILADLAEYCTHIAFMQHGVFRDFGTVHEVIEGQRSELARYRVRLADRIGDLPSRIRSIPALATNDTLQIQDYVLTFDYSSDPANAAELLAALISAGLPVSEFRPLTLDLEEAYLRTGIRQVD